MRTPSFRSARVTLAAAAVSVSALGIALGGCSSSSTAATTTTLSPAQSIRALCAVVTPPQIRQALDTDVKSAQIVASKNSVTCTYPSTNSANSVIVTYLSDVTQQEFDSQLQKATTQHGPITKVSGLGDSAYYVTVPTAAGTATSLVVLHGQAQFVITSTAGFANIESLAKRIIYVVESQG